MDHSKKLAWVQAMTKMGLQHVQHYDEGGVTSSTTQGNVGQNLQQNDSAGTALAGAGVGAATGAAAGSVVPGFGTAIGAGVGALVGASTGLAATLTSQNGYNAQLAPTTQSDYSSLLNAGANTALNANPVNSALAQEQGLSNQYGQIASGQGPNPAQALLSQQTGQNVAQQAALQAGQRGASGNVGLMARQIGQQGAATQQAATSNAAVNQSNQQLNALGAQGTLQNQIASQGLGEQGVGAQVLGTATTAQNAQNANLVNNYGQAQSLNQATAAQNAQSTNMTLAGLLGGAGAISAMGKSEGGEIHGYAGGGDVHIHHHYADGGQVADNSPPPSPQANPISAGFMGATGAAGIQQAGQNATKAVKGYDDGGDVTGGATGALIGQDMGGVDSTPDTYTPLAATQGAQQGVDQAVGAQGQANPLLSNALKFAQGFKQGQSKATAGLGQYGKVIQYLHFSEGGDVPGKVPAMVSPGEVYLTPEHVQQVISGKANPLKIGHKYAGLAKVHGDSRKNDTIPVTLDDGGVIIPRHVVNKMDAKEAERFVLRAHAKRGSSND